MRHDREEVWSKICIIDEELKQLLLYASHPSKTAAHNAPKKYYAMQQRLNATMGQKGKREFVAISSGSSSRSLDAIGHLYSRTFERGSSVFHLLRYAMSEGKNQEESRMRPHHLRTVVAFTPMGIEERKVRPSAPRYCWEKVIDE